jgi:hypothetical protein
MLMGGSKKQIDDTQTMIVVGINRLKEEYDLGKYDQLKEENWRKQTRIWLSVGVSLLSIACKFLGIDSAPLYGLCFNCIIHVVL